MRPRVSNGLTTWPTIEFISYDISSAKVVVYLIGTIKLEQARQNPLHLLQILTNLNRYHLLPNDVQLVLRSREFFLIFVVKLSVFTFQMLDICLVLQVLDGSFVQCVALDEHVLRVDLWVIDVVGMRADLRGLIEALSNEVVW